MIRSVFCGGLVTAEVLHSWGYAIQRLCPWCDAEEDSAFHRILKCQWPEAVAIREGVFTPQFLRWAQPRQLDLFLHRFWVPPPKLKFEVDMAADD